MSIAFHITHEAIRKVGGIGAVLHGLITTDAYRNRFSRTILVGPLFEFSGEKEEIIGKEAKILYSSLHNMRERYADEFGRMEREYNCRIIYGRKKITDEFNPANSTEVEIVAVWVWEMKREKIDFFKYLLWRHFAIDSMKFEQIHDYEQYIRLGTVYGEIVEILAENEDAYHFGHEYMGVPSLLKIEIERREGRRKRDITIFYAHEVAPARNIVETISGHDISFYNILRFDLNSSKKMAERFPSYTENYRAELIRKHEAFDRIFAVGDYVVEEYRYLAPEVKQEKIFIVYNGTPLKKVTVEGKRESKRRLKNFCKKALNFEPDIIFTHVARLIVSKGIWRDLRVLYHLDDLLYQRGLKGCYILLSSLIVTGRPPDAVKEMNRYGWPVVHRKGWPDLVDLEEITFDSIHNFNLNSLAIKGIFINQYGFSRESIGPLLDEDTEFTDIRLGSDVEFGQSIYEPFGIAPLEVVTAGGLPVISTSSGAFHFLRERCTGNCFFAFDYLALPPEAKERFRTPEDLLRMSIHERDLIEDNIVRRNIHILFSLILERAEREPIPSLEQVEPLGWETIAERLTGFL